MTKRQRRVQDKNQGNNNAKRPGSEREQALTALVRQESLDSLLQRTEHSPDSLTPMDMAQLQRTIGNRAVGELGDPSSSARITIQAKLTLGPVGDKYEQEADQVAKQVVQQTAQRQEEEEEELQMKPADSIQRQEEEEELQMKPIASIQRQEEEEELQMKPILSIQRQEEEEELQMKPMYSVEGGPVSAEIEDSIQAARGSGQPLSDNVRQPMEQAFGDDFSGVRVHTDQRADALNHSLRAKAFTTGQDIFFRDKEYRPDSSEGKQLIAHELTHTIQQGGGQLASQRTIQRTRAPQAFVKDEKFLRVINPEELKKGKIINLAYNIWTRSTKKIDFKKEKENTKYDLNEAKEYADTDEYAKEMVIKLGKKLVLLRSLEAKINQIKELLKKTDINELQKELTEAKGRFIKLKKEHDNPSKFKDLPSLPGKVLKAWRVWRFKKKNEKRIFELYGTGKTSKGLEGTMTWLEAIDPSHRIHDDFGPLWKEWLEKGKAEPFFEWVNKAYPIKTKVKYLKDEEKRDYAVVFTGRKVERPPNAQKQIPLREGSLAYVMDHNGTFYMASKYTSPQIPARPRKTTPLPPRPGEALRHSSFLAGIPAAAAGHVRLGSGLVVEKIDTGSGHYKPGIQQIINALEALNKAGVDIASIQIGVHDPSASTSLINNVMKIATAKFNGLEFYRALIHLYRMTTSKSGVKGSIRGKPATVSGKPAPIGATRIDEYDWSKGGKLTFTPGKDSDIMPVRPELSKYINIAHILKETVMGKDYENAVRSFVFGAYGSISVGDYKPTIPQKTKRSRKSPPPTQQQKSMAKQMKKKLVQETNVEKKKKIFEEFMRQMKRTGTK